jgi:predicted nucleic acid-binding protein
MYLLDTSVVSELRKANSGSADANVLQYVEFDPRKSALRL